MESKITTRNDPNQIRVIRQITYFRERVLFIIIFAGTRKQKTRVRIISLLKVIKAPPIGGRITP